MSTSAVVLGPEAERLKEKVVAIVGVGGTGCTVASMLARMGIKKLVLIDRDLVEKSNLERQTLFTSSDGGKPKAVVAKERLSEFCDIEEQFSDLNFKNIDFEGVDLVIDCTDNNETRLLINDYCKKNTIPWIYSGAIGTVGGVYFNEPDGPCFSCFTEDKHGETCNDAGVLNATVSLIGSLVASLAIQYLATSEFESQLLRINLTNNTLTKVTVNQNTNCEACHGEFQYLNGSKTKKMVKFCDRGRFHTFLNKKLNMDELKGRFSKYDVKADAYSLQFDDFMIFNYGRVIINADTEQEAKKKYDEVIGI